MRGFGRRDSQKFALIGDQFFSVSWGDTIVVFRMKHLGLGVIGGLSLLALAGCASPMDPELRQSPNYSLGYNDGCQTGNGRITGFKSTVQRNEDLYEDDRAYEGGWREGYSACGGENYRDSDVFGGEDKWHSQGSI
jgi:hypothetical protein